jgi:GH35 family endo-1,4-beta-xylanase
LFRAIIGPEYVELAFAFVRQQLPSARLLYNDFYNHFEQGPRTGVTREIVSRLADKGLIDYVGLEMHLTGDQPPDKTDVAQTMQSYGLPIFVTEFDVNLALGRGTREERFAKQAQIYRDMLAAALESGVCQNFVVFQIVDKFTIWETIPTFRGYSPDAVPSPYDDDFSPKSAYLAMADVLRGAAGG